MCATITQERSRKIWRRIKQCPGRNKDGSPCDSKPTQRHHIVWKSRGGIGLRNNRQLVCSACHVFFHKPGNGRSGERIEVFFSRIFNDKIAIKQST